MNAIEIAAIGLKQDLDRLQIVSQNVANLGTPAYKRQLAVQRPFAEMIDAADTLQAATDARAGKLNATGGALDVALPDAHYLLLELTDGSQALSRVGAFQIDTDGALRTLAGHAVMGSRGRITLRADQRQDLQIDAQGQLRHGDQVIDSLALVTPKRPEALQVLGDGLYAAEGADWVAAKAVHGVRTGHLEQSNVMPSQEMVQLMTATRHAETMVRLFQAADDMQATAIRRFGESN